MNIPLQYLSGSDLPHADSQSRSYTYKFLLDSETPMRAAFRAKKLEVGLRLSGLTDSR